MQEYTSAMTSVNGNKLPASTRKINWELFRNKTVLDWGCGRYNNLGKYLKENFNINYLGYDPYWKTEEENTNLFNYYPDLIICNSVLNVIKEDHIVSSIIGIFLLYDIPFVIQIYEGNKSGIGKNSKKGCWQRNERTSNYLFHPSLSIHCGLITNDKTIIL